MSKIMKKKQKLIVQKYGGTSLGDTSKIKNTAKRIVAHIKSGDKMVVVVSAMGETTDDLIKLASEINKSPTERELDMLISSGEQVSSSLLAMAIHKLGVGAVSLTGSQVGIHTDIHHSKARIMKINDNRILDELKKNKVVVITGFQGLTPYNDIATLGRGGSDLSAVAIASVLKADVCEIFTDVDGIYTTDPRIIKTARKLNQISFDEMLELAARGAQVMHSRAVEVAKKYNIVLHVRSSLYNKKGTMIMNKKSLIEEPIVRGVALTDDEVKITIVDVPDRVGVAARIFELLSKLNVNIDMIVQNVSSKGKTDISFTIPKKDLTLVKGKVDGILKKIGVKKVLYDSDISKISIVGIGMKSHSGVASQCFSILAKNKINIEMISTSEISISCVVKKKYGKKALKALHEGFGLSK